MGELNNNDAALNGKVVVLFCCPLVAVRGNVEGSGYETTKVWKKGVA